MAKKAARNEAVAAPFAGFPPDALGFLADLAANNDRTWFDANRSRYETALKAPLGALVDALAFAFAVREFPLTGSAKGSVFRIHRDTRFSKDKSPYKTNAGAVLSRDGSKTPIGVFYVHLDPAGCFTAAGFYRPEPDPLAALRRGMIDDPERWQGVEAAIAAAGLALGTEDAAVRLPRGIDPEEAAAVGPAIRLKSLIVQRSLPPDLIAAPDLVDALVAFAGDARPLLDFGWWALARTGAPVSQHFGRR